MLKTSNMVYKTLVVGVIVLFLGVVFQPSVAVQLEEEIDIVQAPPIIEFSYEPLGGNWMTGWWCAIYVLAMDETSGMDRLEIYFNDELKEIIYSYGGPICEFVWEFKYPPVPFIIIKAIAYDNAGNRAEASLNLRDLDLNRHSRDNFYNNNIKNDFFKEIIDRFLLLEIFLRIIEILR